MKRRGFSLLEVMVATFIMAIAVVALLSNLTTSLRTASRLTDHDRAAMLARHKMEELLLVPILPTAQVLEGAFSPEETGGARARWRARAVVFEAPPGAGPGIEILERVELRIDFGAPESNTGRSFSLEAYRRRPLRADEPPPIPYLGAPL